MALSVSRSNLYERPTELPAKRGHYTKLADDELLPQIIDIVDGRPTYGYRRVWALLNFKLKEMKLPRVNHKRVYRIMKQHGLLLARKPNGVRSVPILVKLLRKIAIRGGVPMGLSLGAQMAKK